MQGQPAVRGLPGRDSASSSSGPSGPTPWSLLPVLTLQTPSPHCFTAGPYRDHFYSSLLDVSKDVLHSQRACELNPGGQEPGGPVPGDTAGGTGGPHGGLCFLFCVLQTFYVRQGLVDLETWGLWVTLEGAM